MTDDIVARLRALASEFPTLDGIMDSEWTNAANEIERLRAGGCARGQTTTQFCAEAERLRAERDDARRRLCAELLEVEGHPFGWKGARGAEGIAERLGWDCFKEDSK